MSHTKVSWIFWINIRHKKWFTNTFKTRGANFLEIHFYGHEISIGMPWMKQVVEYYAELNQLFIIEQTNNQNRKRSRPDS